MMDDSLKAKWQILIEAERETFERAARNADSAGPAKRTNLSRDWFRASSSLLKEHCRLISIGEPPSPFPIEAIRRAANLMDALATGRLPQPVTDASASGGRPERWPGERKDVATAISYLHYVKAKLITDRAPNVSVSCAFQVDRTTVQKWWRNREEICKGIEQTPVDQFPNALSVAGARYHFNRTGERTEGVE